MIDTAITLQQPEGNPLQLPEPFQPHALFQALFWKPRFLVDAPLTAHLPFLFWLASVQRPRRIGVLGCDDGAAHFALCQALDRLALDGLGGDGHVHGLGFWRDPKSDQTTQPPLAMRRHAEMLYEGLSQFDAADTLEDALEHMPSAGFDLLLVDLAALPPASPIFGVDLTGYLAAGGILLLHGTARLRESDTGKRSLERLLATRAHVLFPAGEGLVMVAPSRDMIPPVQALFDAAPTGKLRRDVEQVFRRCGQGLQAAAQAAAQLDARRRAEKTTAESTAQLRQMEKDLAALRSGYEQRGTHLAQIQSELFDLRQGAKDKEAVEAALRTAQATLEAECAAKAKEIATLTQSAEELRARAAQADKALAETQETLATTQAALKEATSALAAARAAHAAERDSRFTETAALTKLAEELRSGAEAAEGALASMRSAHEAERDIWTRETAALRQMAEELRGRLVAAEGAPDTEQSQIEALKRIVDDLRKAEQAQAREIAALQGEKRMLLESTSWRITGPMRALKRSLGRKH